MTNGASTVPPAAYGALSQAQGPQAIRRLFTHIAPDFDAPLDDFADYR